MDTENSKPDPDVAEPTEENQKSSPKEIDSDKENSSEEKIPFNEPDEMPREVKGILVYHRGRGKRDKRITWRAETNLVQVQYFDKNERVNKLKTTDLISKDWNRNETKIPFEDMPTPPPKFPKLKEIPDLIGGKKKTPSRFQKISADMLSGFVKMHKFH